jgi:hypothetical protein
MADQVQEFEELSQQLAKHAEQLTAHAPKGKAANAADICAYWKIAKPFVELAIKLLGKLPFQWAKTLVKGLQALDDAMNTFCPA